MEAGDSRLFVDAASDIFAIISPHVPHTHAARVFSQISHALQRAQEASTEASALLRASQAGLERERRLREEDVGRHLSRLRDLQEVLKERVERDAVASKKRQALRRRLKEEKAKCSRLEEKLRDTDGRFRRLTQELEKNMHSLAHRWSTKMTEAVSEAREKGRAEALSTEAELADREGRTAASRQQEVSDLRSKVSALEVENCKLRDRLRCRPRAQRPAAMSRHESGTPGPMNDEHGRQTPEVGITSGARIATPGGGLSEGGDREKHDDCARSGSSASMSKSASSVANSSGMPGARPSGSSLHSSVAHASAEGCAALMGGSKPRDARFLRGGRRSGGEDSRRAHFEPRHRGDPEVREKRVPCGTKGQGKAREGDPRSRPACLIHDENKSGGCPSTTGALPYSRTSSSRDEALPSDSRCRREMSPPKSSPPLPSTLATSGASPNQPRVRERGGKSAGSGGRLRKAYFLEQHDERDSAPDRDEDRLASLSPDGHHPEGFCTDRGVDSSGVSGENTSQVFSEVWPQRQPKVTRADRRAVRQLGCKQRTPHRQEPSLIDGHNEAPSKELSGHASGVSPSVGAGEAGPVASPGPRRSPPVCKSDSPEPQVPVRSTDLHGGIATRRRSGSSTSDSHEPGFELPSASEAPDGRRLGSSGASHKGIRVLSAFEYPSLGQNIVTSHGDAADPEIRGGRRRVGFNVSLAWESPDVSGIADSSGTKGSVAEPDGNFGTDQSAPLWQATVRRDKTDRENLTNDRVAPGRMKLDVDTPAVSALAKSGSRSCGNSSRRVRDVTAPVWSGLSSPLGRDGLAVGHEDAGIRGHEERSKLRPGSPPSTGLESCLDDLLRRLDISPSGRSARIDVEQGAAHGEPCRHETGIVSAGEIASGVREDHGDDAVASGRVCV